MKICLDIHGVLDTYPGFFMNLLEMVDYEEVHIVTGVMITDRLIEQLKSFNQGKVFWTHLVSIEDDLLAEGTSPVEVTSEGVNVFNEAIWDSFKGMYCDSHRIDIHFDDTVAYARYFNSRVTKFQLVKPVSPESAEDWILEDIARKIPESGLDGAFEKVEINFKVTPDENCLYCNEFNELEGICKLRGGVILNPEFNTCEEFLHIDHEVTAYSDQKAKPTPGVFKNRCCAACESFDESFKVCSLSCAEILFPEEEVCLDFQINEYT